MEKTLPKNLHEWKSYAIKDGWTGQEIDVRDGRPYLYTNKRCLLTVEVTPDDGPLWRAWTDILEHEKSECAPLDEFTTNNLDGRHLVIERACETCSTGEDAVGVDIIIHGSDCPDCDGSGKVLRLVSETAEPVNVNAHISGTVTTYDRPTAWLQMCWFAVDLRAEYRPEKQTAALRFISKAGERETVRREGV